MAGKFYRKLGGKRYAAWKGYPTKAGAKKEAARLRKQGISTRVIAASRHDVESHGIRYEVMVSK